MILVTGADSNLGRCVVNLLLEKGKPARCFIRHQSRKNRLPRTEIEIFYGDLENEWSLEKALSGITTLINVAPIGLARLVVQACLNKGIKRTIFVSSTRLFARVFDDVVRQVKEGEEIVKNSGLDYTLIRPSMIYSDDEDRNISVLAKIIGTLPIVPIFGNGKNLLQPVFVWDVARVIIAALENDVSIKREYTIAGPEPLEYSLVIKQIIAALGKKRILLRLPFWLGKISAQVLQLLSRRPLITIDQIERLREDRSFDTSAARHDLGFDPIPFSEGLSLKFHQRIIT